MYSIIDLIGYPKGPRSSHLTVGKTSEGDFVFFNGLADFGGLVRRNSNDLKSQTAELGFGITQLNQLPVTVRPPAASIDTEYSGRALDSPPPPPRHPSAGC